MARIIWTKNYAKKIYQELCVANDNKPLTHKQIYANGYSTLPQKIIEYWGSKETLELELGLQPLRITWNRDMVKNTYNNLCIKNGNRASTQDECYSIQGLYSAIAKFFNNKFELDMELGYTPNSIKWTRKMVIDEYSKISSMNGNKSTPIPKSVNGGDLRKAVITFFGSKENLDIEFGYTPRRNTRNKKTTIEEYKKLCLENGDRPLTHAELKDKTMGLSDSINRKFGSKMELDILLGYKPIKNFNWNKNTVKETYHKLCLENGDRPLTTDVLIEMGHNDLVTAFGRHYKKIDLDNDLGYETITYWDMDLVKKTYHDLCLSVGDRVITDNELKVMGYGNLVGSIKKYYGGKLKLDLLLGYLPNHMFLLTNGILVRSSYEVLFSNFLIHNNIPFKYDERLETSTRCRYDFLIHDIHGNEVFVEIWGYTIDGKNIGKRTDNYEKQKTFKLELYKSLDKTLMGINGRVFKERNSDELQNDLRELLITFNIKKSGFKVLSIDEMMNSKNTNPWNKDIVKETYHKLCLENGDKGLRAKDVVELYGSNSLLKAIHTYWGGKIKLDENLGYEPFHRVRTKNDIILEYHKLRLKLNIDIIRSDTLREHTRGLDGAIYKCFDSREDFYKEYNDYVKTNH